MILQPGLGSAGQARLVLHVEMGPGMSKAVSACMCLAPQLGWPMSWELAGHFRLSTQPLCVDAWSFLRLEDLRSVGLFT